MTFDTATSTTLQVQRGLSLRTIAIGQIPYATFCVKDIFGYVGVSLIHPCFIVSMMMMQRKTVSLANGWEERGA